MTNSQQSEKEVFYTRLDSYLRAEDWWKADYVTSKLMFLAAGTRGKWLEVEEIENFPCQDLYKINELWLHYSGGKFGFSVQKEIYHSLGGTKENNQEVWEKFSALVG